MDSQTIKFMNNIGAGVAFGTRNRYQKPSHKSRQKSIGSSAVVDDRRNSLLVAVVTEVTSADVTMNKADNVAVDTPAAVRCDKSQSKLCEKTPMIAIYSVNGRTMPRPSITNPTLNPQSALPTEA